MCVDLVKQGEGCTEGMKYMSSLVQKAVTDQPIPGGYRSVGYGDVQKLPGGRDIKEEVGCERVFVSVGKEGKAKPYVSKWVLPIGSCEA